MVTASPDWQGQGLVPQRPPLDPRLNSVTRTLSSLPTLCSAPFCNGVIGRLTLSRMTCDSHQQIQSHILPPWQPQREEDAPSHQCQPKFEVQELIPIGSTRWTHSPWPGERGVLSGQAEALGLALGLAVGPPHLNQKKGRERVLSRTCQ